NLETMPKHIQKIAVTVTIYEAAERRQNFGQVSNSYIRVLNSENDEEILRYDLGEEFSIETAITVCEIYKYNGEWKFSAVGAGFEGGLEALCRNYGLNV
ncbi:TerD family protein, partial [Clostridioides difficile]